MESTQRNVIEMARDCRAGRRINKVVKQMDIKPGTDYIFCAYGFTLDEYAVAHALEGKRN